jgi:hypothetical protein
LGDRAVSNVHRLSDLRDACAIAKRTSENRASSKSAARASLSVVGERGSGGLEGSAVKCRVQADEVAVARRRTPFDIHAS